MKKFLSLLLVTVLALVVTGCSFGKDDSTPQPPVQVEDTNDTPPTPQTDNGDVNDVDNADTAGQDGAEPEEKEFDPNAFNDEEINELIAMLEGMVEVE